jgi:glycerol-3-phosphate cytidylyltransferase-like family protein
MEQVRNFVDAIASGKNMDAESHFNQALAQKVGSALETKRVEVASTFVTDHISEVEEDSE